MLRTLSPTPEQWDAFVAAQPRAHVLQLSAWGDLKGAYGWGVERIAIGDEAGNILAGAQVLFRDFPLRTGKMAYLAMGPYAHTESEWQFLWKQISRVCAKRRATFLRWEPGIYREDETLPEVKRWGFHPSAQTIQPPRTILIDLRGDDDAILARMNQGTRRKIRQSLKNDVVYYEATTADVAKFNSMMQVTGSRNDFGVHEPGYYEKAYQLFVPQHAALILAEHEGDTLAGVFVFAVRRTAWYLYGASSSEKRNLMASYGVQWKAMQWAKARGCNTYDLWGIPDEDEATLEAQFQEREDGLWGVYGFKRGWGGQVVRSLGAWDKAYNALSYNLYRTAVWFQENQR
ncbi:MAG: peptidoglycan bridge formation glycyltransferase FemA/FemB family protein [bacterium]|nr:peptidoglycan bridge formation glycyltransferase FemA/FemB family protein [bacterium]